MLEHTTLTLLSIIIFIITYGVIVWDKFDRVLVALAGGLSMILIGILDQDTAIAEVDFNTLGLLIGMMIIVMVTKRSGVFEYIALKMVKIAKADPFRVIILLSLATGLLSALLDNVTTIMLIVPVTISVAKDLKVRAIPLVIAEVFASNIGGAATLVGDPPNILIGSATGFSFAQFLMYNGVIAIPLLILTTLIFAFISRKGMKLHEGVKEEVMALDEHGLIKDKGLLYKSIAVLGLVVIAFLLHGVLHIESATIALVGAVALLSISGVKSERIFHEVEWKTIFFFIGLFILVGGIKETGVIASMAKSVLELTHGNTETAAIAVLWVSAIASAFIDNIPFVATMIPMIQDISTMSGMDVTPLWWALSLGACFGGNGTIIGASANLIAAGMLEEHGHKLRFREYFKIAFPMMILTIAIANVYIVLRFFV
jgi:Na+/H+ antiporter NhaD/arsenite permease-like protein